jgi:hypothetical protein
MSGSQVGIGPGRAGIGGPHAQEDLALAAAWRPETRSAGAYDR